MTHAKEIIEKYLNSGGGSRNSQKVFVEWLSAPIDADLKDELLKEEWEKGGSLSEDAVSRSFNQVKTKIHRRTTVGRLKYWSFSAVASIAVAVLLYTCLPKSYDAVQHTVVQPVAQMKECYAANGEKKVVTLPDSTTIILNSGSLLVYPENFTASERQVYLTGEAIFDVAKSDECPFVVTTPDLTIKVHGTLFNVSSYVDADYAAITLKEGSVSVLDKKGGEFLLSPNQALKYENDSEKVSVAQADVEEAFAWKDGRLCFKSASIHTIIKAIERYYGIKVYLTTSRYDDECLTAKFVHGETVEEMLSALSLIIPGMKWNMENSIVYIK